MLGLLDHPDAFKVRKLYEFDGMTDGIEYKDETLTPMSAEYAEYLKDQINMFYRTPYGFTYDASTGILKILCHYLAGWELYSNEIEIKEFAAVGQLQINENFKQAQDSLAGGAIMIAPPVSEDYWLFRVPLFKDQAILGFPKFGTIGIGFAQEEDWNTNLPYQMDTEEIVNHIYHNKKYGKITRGMVRKAVKIVQEFAAEVMSAEEETL
jgi:hypothetical protein